MKNKTASKKQEKSLAYVVARRDAVITAANTIKRYALISMVMLAITIAVAGLSIAQKYNSVFFRVDNESRIVKLIPLSKPNMSDAAIIQWSTNALVDTFDVAFYNIHKRLNKTTAKWFTDDGGDSILKLLKKSGNFDAIIDEELIVNLAITDTPLIVKKHKPANSRYWRWMVRANGVMTFRTRTAVHTNPVLFDMIITRTGTVGVGISKIIMKNCQKDGYCG